jgi:uncharacterized protein (DUF2141 family)
MIKPYFLLCCILISCASVQTLSGGDKDTAAPRIIKTSIDSGATSVSVSQFRFIFDENITTTKVNELLIVSPTQKQNPVLDVKGKELTLSLKDTLLPNTTYTVKFNGCVLDVNENNPILDYSYLFSTGLYLDSGKLSGHIKDITTNLPCNTCNVQLYTSNSDSVIIKHKPDYLTKTNETGYFQFNNLPTRNFKLVALKDVNKNLMLDNNELVSLATEIYTDKIIPDTINIFPFYHYVDYKPRLLHPKEPGVLRIAINKPLKHISHLYIDNSLKDYQLSPSKDTINYYYQPTKDTSSVLLTIDTNQFLFTYVNPLSQYIKPIRLIASNSNNLTIINSNYRIKGIDKNKILILIDSNVVSATDIYHNDYQVIIKYPLNLIPNKIEIQESGITDIIGNKNVDYNQALLLQKHTNTNLNLTINIDTNNYILHLYKGNSLYKTEYIKFSKNLTINNLPQGTYSCQLIKDLNNNQIWDTGDYFGHINPEPILFTEPFDMRENWDKNLIINSL